MGLAQVNLIRRVSGYEPEPGARAAAEDPANVEAQSSVATSKWPPTGRIEEGFDRLLGTIRRTSGDERERARVHLVSLFDVFPPGDPRVTKARGSLSSLHLLSGAAPPGQRLRASAAWHPRSVPAGGQRRGQGGQLIRA